MAFDRIGCRRFSRVLSFSAAVEGERVGIDWRVEPGRDKRLIREGQREDIGQVRTQQ